MSDDPILSALARLEAGQARLEADIGGLRAELKADIGSLRAEITDVRTALMARLDRQQELLDGIRDDMAVTMNAALRGHDMVDSTRLELRSLSEQVQIMFRQLKKLETRVREITGDA